MSDAISVGLCVQCGNDRTPHGRATWGDGRFGLVKFSRGEKGGRWYVFFKRRFFFVLFFFFFASALPGRELLGVACVLLFSFVWGFFVICEAKM